MKTYLLGELSQSLQTLLRPAFPFEKLDYGRGTHLCLLYGCGNQYRDGERIGRVDIQVDLLVHSGPSIRYASRVKYTYWAWLFAMFSQDRVRGQGTKIAGITRRLRFGREGARLKPHHLLHQA